MSPSRPLPGLWRAGSLRPLPWQQCGLGGHLAEVFIASLSCLFSFKQQNLENRQADVEYEVRCLLNKPGKP